MKAVQKIGFIVVMLFSMSALASNQFTAERIAERVAPSANPCVEGKDCAGPAPVVAEAAPAAAPSGKDTYQAKCFACHGTGAAGAPKLGDKDAWAPRIAQGIDVLYSHAISGFNAMPPKGACGDCSDDSIKAVVDYLVENSK
ncbi:cytochrome c5 family protein [Gammaproteobacteria bacterium 45_16_T64]|nr:cytochrome c5 family protein [Gammaproteobacteria bacterium 45_16_T64]